MLPGLEAALRPGGAAHGADIAARARQVNVLIWDKHASVSGIFSLAICLIGGSLYQQAPPRVQGPEGESLKRPGSHTEESEEELEPVPGSLRR
jgi:hypothetical protein